MNTSHSSTPKLLPEQASSVKEDHGAFLPDLILPHRDSEEDDDNVLEKSVEDSKDVGIKNELTPMTNEESEAFKQQLQKLFEPLYLAAGRLNDTMTKDRQKTDEISNDETTEDDMERAIEWAKQQKQSLLNKKQ